MIDNFKVTPGKVLVKEIPFDRVTKGGLFVPDNSNYRTIKGEVISIGHDKYIPEGELSIGTTILYGAHAGTKIKIDRVVYILLNTVDVYASQINGKLKVLASPSIIVEVDKMYKDHVKMGNVDLFVDPLYNRTHNVKYCGTVVSIPNFEPYDDVDDTRKIDPIIQVGDKVYFKYLATDDDRHLMFKDINDHSEKMTIRVFYPWVFCVVRNDEIIPVGGWCLGEPVIEGEGDMVEMMTESGVSTIRVQYFENSKLIKSTYSEKDKQKCIVRHIGKFKDYDSELSIGDVVIGKVINFENNIEGKCYYCFYEESIDAILTN